MKQIGPYLIILLITVISVLVPFVIHVFLSRTCRLFTDPVARQKGAILSCLLGLGLVLAALITWVNLNGLSRASDNWWSIVFTIGVYLLWSYVYFHFFNMSETARRIRILLGDPQPPTLKRIDSNQSYTCDKMIKIRLQRLVSLGELRKIDNKYLTGKRILVFPSFIISCLHNLLFHSPKHKVED